MNYKVIAPAEYMTMYMPVAEAIDGIWSSSKKRGFMIIPPPMPSAAPATPVRTAIMLSFNVFLVSN